MRNLKGGKNEGKEDGKKLRNEDRGGKSVRSESIKREREGEEEERNTERKKESMEEKW